MRMMLTIVVWVVCAAIAAPLIRLVLDMVWPDKRKLRRKKQ